MVIGAGSVGWGVHTGDMNSITETEDEVAVQLDNSLARQRWHLYGFCPSCKSLIPVTEAEPNSLDPDDSETFVFEAMTCSFCKAQLPAA
jgi:hypothetical protein